MEENIRFIIGLGNSGKEYENTPHNFGKMLLETITKKKCLPWIKEKEFYWTNSNPSYVYLNGYMNHSGSAVKSLLKKFDCPSKEILICTDDFDIPLGRIRIRKNGSAGSHNGLKSIQEELVTQDYPRLRLGTGPLPTDKDPTHFVLQPFSKEDKKLMEETLLMATTAIETTLLEGIEKAMNRFN